MVAKVDIPAHAAAAGLLVIYGVGKVHGDGPEVVVDLVRKCGAVGINGPNLTRIRMVIEHLGEAPVLLED